MSVIFPRYCSSPLTYFNLNILWYNAVCSGHYVPGLNMVSTNKYQIRDSSSHEVPCKQTLMQLCTKNIGRNRRFNALFTVVKNPVWNFSKVWQETNTKIQSQFFFISLDFDYHTRYKCSVSECTTVTPNQNFVLHIVYFHNRADLEHPLLL